jgi:hypothetical protein
MAPLRRLAGTLIGLLLAGSCANGVAPPPEPIGSNLIQFDDPDGKLVATGAMIRDLVWETLGAVTERLPVTGVTIRLIPDPSRAIGGYGIGGRTPTATTISIYLDPEFPDFARLLPSRLPQMVAHELHHAVRHRGPGYGGTLLEAMVSEGLADRFSVELLGVSLPPWSRAIAPDQVASLLAAAEPELDSARYDHDRWFFGAGGLPRWAGYSLGYHLVERYQADHPAESAADLVARPAAAFRHR